MIKTIDTTAQVTALAAGVDLPAAGDQLGQLGTGQPRSRAATYRPLVRLDRWSRQP
jgi:hypothetical protein